MPVDCELMFECNTPAAYRPFDLDDCGRGFQLHPEPYVAPTFAHFDRVSSTTTGIANNSYNKSNMSLTLQPLRPILMVRSQPESPTEELDEPLSPEPPMTPTKAKKRVVFADDKGLMLTHVKIMTEPSDCPPKLSEDLLFQVTKGTSASVSPDRWEPLFAQPASDYVVFRQKLDRDCVSLENVIVKEAEESVLGTVKVKNISFDKEVFVRVTFDTWATHQDVSATFVPSGTEGTAVYDLYDTFSFSLDIPPGVAGQNRNLEFCVCYKCNETEYWDSNGGANYKLMSKVDETKLVQNKLSSNEVSEELEEQISERTSTEAILIKMIQYIERVYGIIHHSAEN